MLKTFGMRRKQRLVAAWSLVAVGSLGLLGMSAVTVPHLIHAQSTLVVTQCQNDTQLRDMVATANSEDANDSITFNCPSNERTITLTADSGPLGIFSAMTIDGGGDITLSGGGAVQVFFADATDGTGFTLENMTVTGGKWDGNTQCDSDTTPGGGALYNDGAVALSNDTFTQNTVTDAPYCPAEGGAVYNDVEGVVTITNSTFTSNTAVATINDSGSDYSLGGAIENYGTLNMQHSTVSGNASTSADVEAYGGGIDNISNPEAATATAVITDSTITDNTANYTGSNAYGDSMGGGIENLGGNLTLTGSTVAGNVATAPATYSSGGGIANFGEGSVATVENSTIVNNTAEGGFGGGIYIGEANSTAIVNSTIAYNAAPNGTGGGIYNSEKGLSIGGSIIAENSAYSPDDGPDCFLYDSFAKATDLGYNLESGSDCGLSGTGDQQNTDPKLATTTVGAQTEALLANNGGATQTDALLDRSPAINQIPSSGKTFSVNGATQNACPATDQRGFARPEGTLTQCSVGAFEFAPQTTIALSPTTATYGNTLTLVATIGVSAAGAGEGLPTCGKVIIDYEGTSIGTLDLSTAHVNDTNDTETVSLTLPNETTIPAGSAALTVSYSGETVQGGCETPGDFENSDTAQSLSVAQAPTSVILTSSTTSVTSGQSVTLTATVDPVVMPTSGAVTFYNGSSLLGTTTLKGGNVATFLTPALGTGTYTFTAKYGGTTNFAASGASTGVKVTVASSTGLSGNGATISPVTAQAPSGNGAAHTPSNVKAPARPKAHTASHAARQGMSFSLALAILLAILCFGLMGGGAVLLVRTRKVEQR